MIFEENRPPSREEGNKTDDFSLVYRVKLHKKSTVMERSYQGLSQQFPWGPSVFSYAIKREAWWIFLPPGGALSPSITTIAQNIKKKLGVLSATRP